MPTFNFKGKQYLITEKQCNEIAAFILRNYNKLPKKERERAEYWLKSGFLLKSDFKEDVVKKGYALPIGNAKTKSNEDREERGFSFLQPLRPDPEEPEEKEPETEEPEE